MDETIHYIKEFLLGEGNEKLAHLVGYTADESEFPHYKVVVIPSPFFDTDFYGQPYSLPLLPLKTLENIPVLYGKPNIEKHGDTFIVHADLIASAYFLLTRYEEWLRTDGRDEHGRFCGKKSLPAKAGFLHRPVVDEYGSLLRRLLQESGVEGVAEMPDKIRKIYLTHDIDHAFRYFGLRNYAGGLYRSLRGKKGELKAMLKTLFGSYKSDPYFTYPFIFSQNEKLSNLPTETVFFLKSPVKTACQDKPVYRLSSKKIKKLLEEIKTHAASLGLHSSYLSGDHPELIAYEKAQLEQFTGCKITQNRHHYLRLKEPANTQFLLAAGITDDFTMGYADVAGFRLGTCRPVRWINPQTRSVSALKLHPLTIMDCSLTDEKYMNLSFDEALQHALWLINQTKKHHGEVVLLWHNSSLVAENIFPHKQLYEKLTDAITQIHQC